LVPLLHLAEISKDGVNLEKGKQEILALCDEDSEGFAVWSVKFSGDGRELIAGTNDCSIYIYDIEMGQVLHRIEGHWDDVNTVAFVDPSDSNVVVSGADDYMIKVWDRRSMGTTSKCSGYLIGHTEGLTSISSKGDGRYILSNAKDQTMKLWDIRKMKTSYEKEQYRVDFTPAWDYRWMPYPARVPISHPDDCSAKTFIGHSITRTLIRCYFSPMYTTGQRFAYTGSSDGNIYIFDIESDDIYKIEVAKGARPSHRYSPLVRDLSWHPYLPIMIAGQWTEDGGKLLKIEPNYV
jgi:WD repeat-containing protein 23